MTVHEIHGSELARVTVQITPAGAVPARYETAGGRVRG